MDPGAGRYAGPVRWPPGREAVGDEHLVLRERLGCRWIDHRSVRDRVLTAMAVAVDHPVGYVGDRAALMSTDLGERLVIALRRLGDHVVRVVQDHATAHGNFRGRDARAARRLGRLRGAARCLATR